MLPSHLPKRVRRLWSASTFNSCPPPRNPIDTSLCSLDEKKAQLVVEEIKAFGGDAIAVGGDVSADDFPKKILDATITKYGKLNHIVNNGLSPCSLSVRARFTDFDGFV